MLEYYEATRENPTSKTSNQWGATHGFLMENWRGYTDEVNKLKTLFSDYSLGDHPLWICSCLQKKDIV